MTPADQRIADLRDGIRAEAEALRDRAVKLDEAADHLDVALTIAVDDTTAHLPEPKPKPEPTAGGKRKRTRRSKSPASRRTSPATEAPGKKKKPQGGHAGVTQLAILAHLGDCVGAWRRPADIGRAIDRPGALVAGALRRMHNRGEPRLQLQRLGPRSCQYRLAPEGEESDPDPEPEAVPPHRAPPKRNRGPRPEDVDPDGTRTTDELPKPGRTGRHPAVTGFSVSGPPAGSEARRTRGRAPTPDADIAAKLEDLGRTVLDMNKGAWHTAASLLDGAEARGLIPAGFADAYHRKLEGALDAAADAGRIERESDNEGHRILYRVPA